MAFAQLTYRESLRDIETCLLAQASKLYHMGFSKPIRRSTLADANETRDWRIYAEFAERLIAQARRLYADEDLGVDLSNTVYSAWLTKPVHIEDLRRLLTTLLDARERGLSPADGIDEHGKPLPAALLSNKPADNDNASFSDLRILLVEDNCINRAMAQERLVGLNCEVTTAENGREAVEQVQRTPFDLILMDCQMPEMDGFEATLKIREMIRIGVVAPLPIIAMTANAMAGDRENCLTAGMDEHLSKPVRKHEMIGTLSKWAEGVTKVSA